MSRFAGLVALVGISSIIAIGCSAPAEGDPTASGTSTSATGTSESATGTSELAPVDAFVANAKPLIDANCKGCHSGPQPKGNVDVTKLATEADAKANIATIHKMAEEVEAKKMPPKNMGNLSDEDRAKLVAALKALG